MLYLLPFLFLPFSVSISFFLSLSLSKRKYLSCWYIFHVLFSSIGNRKVIAFFKSSRIFIWNNCLWKWESVNNGRTCQELQRRTSAPKYIVDPCWTETIISYEVEFHTPGNCCLSFSFILYFFSLSCLSSSYFQCNMTYSLRPFQVTSEETCHKFRFLPSELRVLELKWSEWKRNTIRTIWPFLFLMPLFHPAVISPSFFSLIFFLAHPFTVIMCNWSLGTLQTMFFFGKGKREREREREKERMKEKKKIGSEENTLEWKGSTMLLLLIHELWKNWRKVQH